MKNYYLFFLLILTSNVYFAQNNCLQFHNISTDIATYNNTAALNPTDVITVEAWINASGWRTNIWEGSIAGKDGWSAGNTGYMLRCGEGGDLSFNISIGGTWAEARTTTNPMVTGTWYHVAGVYNGSSVKIYINGTEAASVATSGSISTSSQNLLIGNCPADNNRYFNGYIDEVRIWHAAIDPGVINAWKNKTVSLCHPLYASMIAYFQLDDNSPVTNMMETISGSDAGTSVIGASYLLNTNGAFLGSVSGFQQTTASQPNTGSVAPGSANNDVIRLEVEVYSAMNATEFRLRTNGTTNVSDISNAKLWYTGTSSTFSTGSQFGSTVAVPPGAGIDMVFSGSQALSCGTNYFWLSYDISAGATTGNIVDANYQSSIIGGASRTPVTSTPAGSRPIANSCNHSIELTDTYGDGWNGGTVTVSVNGTPVLSNITLAAGSGPQTNTFSASTGDNINVTTTNGGSYPSEMRIIVKDGTGTTIIPLQQPPTTPGVNGTGACSVAPMSFVSTTASQPNTSSVSAGVTNQEVLRMEVVTTGTGSPLSVTQFILRTDGTTNVADIANAKIWYTGTNSTFATSTQFGSTIASPPVPGSNMTFTGTQTLAEGTNYFWLSFDIQPAAVTGNVVDGTFQSVTINGTAHTPSTTSPAGNRLISIIYCTSNATSTADEEIFNVTLGSLNNTSNCSTTGGTGSILNEYSDYTALAAPSLTQGVSYPFSVEVGTCGGNYSNAVAIYIDFNMNGVFTDAGEQVYLSIASSSGPHTEAGSIAIPVTATPGNTRMRVICVETGTPSSISPCGTYSWGETEDYTVQINTAGPMVFSSCTASQPNTTDVSTGTTNQEIIRLEVVTTGVTSPINASEIRIRTNGTTNYATDIADARIWYTGTSSSFSTTNQYGTVVAVPPAPGTNMVFTGTQTLEPGTNYFWLTYSIPAGATPGNFVDGVFQRITVAGVNYSPAITAPAGERTIIDGCHHTLCLYDSGANGWQGGTLTVQVNGSNVLTGVTLAAGSSGTYNFIADDGDVITTIYTAGTNPAENRYEITNPNGAYILSDGHDNEIPSGTSGTGNCSDVPNFTVNGQAYQTGTDCFILTENKNNQSGSVWYNYMVDLSSTFRIDFDIYLGDKDVTFINDGADGMTFAFQNECSAAGGAGGSLGYGGITPSLAIEFDSYMNSLDNNDPADDHLALVSNGNVNHAAGTHLAGPAAIPAGFEDDAWHSVAVRWNAITMTLNIYFDGVLQLTYSGDIVTNIFGGNPIVFWGFTGGTGLYYNRQEVCVTSYPANSSALSDIYCDPCNELVEVAYGAASYTWMLDDGSIDDPTIYNPTMSPTVTTEYTVLIEDACGNFIMDHFTIFVGTLGIELSGLRGECGSTSNLLQWTTLAEINNEYFTVERSHDAINFEVAGYLEGAGNSNTALDYSWSDSRRIPGISYYRLKQTDNDGQESYSEIIPVSCPCNNQYNIYPNPTKGKLNIDIMGTDAQNLVCKIEDMLGREIFSEQIIMEQNSILKTFHLDDILDGIYLIRIIDNASKEIIHTEKVVFSN
ncbi:MAG: BNR-repeat neuraminidase N-terminal domain-containing protein [Bacteroidota bacterium]